MILNNEPLPSHVLLLEIVVYFVQCLELEGQSGNKQFLQRGSSPIKTLAKVVFPTPFEPINIILGWGISNFVFLVSLVIVSIEVSAEKNLTSFTLLFTLLVLYQNHLPDFEQLGIQNPYLLISLLSSFTFVAHIFLYIFPLLMKSSHSL